MDNNSHNDIGETLDEIKDLLDIKNSYSVEEKQEKYLSLKPIKFNTGYKSNYSRNRILFGAPGTGKSYSINEDKDKLLLDGGEYERVTFHPDYSYANFIGTYKPVPCKDSDGKDAITYKYIPGPFMRTYVKALNNSRTNDIRPFLLIIEEINRANVAAVFGEVFQLLDRDDNNVSQYPVQASEDIKKYLAYELGGEPNDYLELIIPDNMFLWATMNSADQGVFPLDTAFRRRWSYVYNGYSEPCKYPAETAVVHYGGQTYAWDVFRGSINNYLIGEGIHEDKLIGPYFLTLRQLADPDAILEKLFLYLWDDVLRFRQESLFTEKSFSAVSAIWAGGKGAPLKLTMSGPVHEAAGSPDAIASSDTVGEKMFTET